MKEKETEPTMIEKKNVRRRNSRVETDNELALRQLRDAWKQISIDAGTEGPNSYGPDPNVVTKPIQ